MKAIYSLGSSISKQRPTKLTAEESASINNNAHIKQLVRRREELRQQSNRSARARRQYERAAKEVTKEKLSLRRDLKAQIRKEFDEKQAVADIKYQISGMGFADDDR